MKRNVGQTVGEPKATNTRNEKICRDNVLKNNFRNSFKRSGGVGGNHLSAGQGDHLLSAAFVRSLKILYGDVPGVLRLSMHRSWQKCFEISRDDEEISLNSSGDGSISSDASDGWQSHDW